MSRFTSHSPLIKKTLYIHHLFSCTVCPYLLLSISYPSFPSFFSPLLSSLVSYPPVTLQTLPSPSSFSLTLFPLIPPPLSIFTTPLLLSLRGTVSIHPPLLAKPFLHPSSLSLGLPFHLDLYVSVGLSILWRPGSKLKWF